jgi:hypothetical protein
MRCHSLQEEQHRPSPSVVVHGSSLEGEVGCR